METEPHLPELNRSASMNTEHHHHSRPDIPVVSRQAGDRNLGSAKTIYDISIRYNDHEYRNVLIQSTIYHSLNDLLIKVLRLGLILRKMAGFQKLDVVFYIKTAD